MRLAEENAFVVHGLAFGREHGPGGIERGEAQSFGVLRLVFAASARRDRRSCVSVSGSRVKASSSPWMAKPSMSEAFSGVYPVRAFFWMNLRLTA